MNSFSEAWLKDYQRRIAGQRAPTGGPVQFTLAAPYKLLNELLRMHHHARTRYAKRLSAEIAGLVTVAYEPPLKARVTIDRYSVKEPDADGVIGGAKILVDCLIRRSDRHPHGLGLIHDDAPDHLILAVRHVKATTREDQRTVVRIELV